MKFTISSKELQSKLSIVSKVILKKNILRILDYAMVSQKDGRFYITGASPDNQMTVGLDLVQIAKGEFKPFCIEVSQFLSMLATLPEQTIELEVDETKNYQTTLRYMGGDFKLSSLLSEGYPVMNSLTDEEIKVEFDVEPSILLPCVKAAQLCVNTEEHHPQLKAIAFDVSQEGVNFVSSDMRMFYCYRYNHGVPFLTKGEPMTILFPPTLVSALEAVVGKAEKATIRANERCVEVVAGDAFLQGTLMKGKYPAYERIIPKESNYHAKIAVNDLVLAIKRASIMAESTNRMLVLTKVPDALVIDSCDINCERSSTNRVEMSDCTMPDGFTMGLSSSAFLTLLGNISTENVNLFFTHPERPVLIKEDAANSALTELILPMHIN